MSEADSAPHPDAPLSDVLRRNLQAMREQRAAEARSANLQDKIALAITNFTGSMAFVYLHMLVYGVWIAINLRLVPGAPVFDPTFVILASEASVEAIFLATFVLISQNRMAALADRRADLDLHINLLTEHEITRIARLMDAMARHMDIDPDAVRDVENIKSDVVPEAVLQEIEQSEQMEMESRNQGDSPALRPDDRQGGRDEHV